MNLFAGISHIILFKYNSSLLLLNVPNSIELVLEPVLEILFLAPELIANYL